jgi:hypothetical protein
MPYRDDNDEDDDDWDDDSDLDSDADFDSGDDDPDDDETVPCPFCKRQILEDTPRCPYCEHYLSEQDFARGSKPLWVIVTAVVCLVAAIWLAFAL